MKKVDWKLIVIIILLVITIVEGIFLINKKDTKIEINKEEKKELTYNENNVVSKISNDIKLEYEIFGEGNYLLLSLTSLEKNITTGSLKVVFKNSNNVVVDTYETLTGLLKINDVYVINLTIPEINNSYAGDIEVYYTPTYMDEESILKDKSLMKLSTQEITEEGTKELNITGVNPYEQKISLIQGVIILYKENKVVYVTHYSKNDIEANGEVNLKIVIPNEIEYDKIETIINELF